MAHLVALDEKRDPLPKGLEPRPLDEAEEDETFLSLVEVIVEARPDSLLVASPFVWPLAKIMPVRLSRLGVGEAADVTRTPELWCCCRVAAISDCQAINLQEIKQMKFLCRLWGTVKYFFLLWFGGKPQRSKPFNFQIKLIFIDFLILSFLEFWVIENVTQFSISFINFINI